MRYWIRHGLRLIWSNNSGSGEDRDRCHLADGIGPNKFGDPRLGPLMC